VGKSGQDYAAGQHDDIIHDLRVHAGYGAGTGPG
jgi:hypothetical protein